VNRQWRGAQQTVAWDNLANRLLSAVITMAGPDEE
jgi:hypothetical protein